MYEKLKYHSAAIQIYMHILLVKLRLLPFNDRLVISKHETVLKSLQRLVKCNYLKTLKLHFRNLFSRLYSSKFYIKFINKLKFLYYFQFDDPNTVKISLNIFLKRTLTEYENRKLYEKSMKKLQKSIIVHEF